MVFVDLTIQFIVAIFIPYQISLAIYRKSSAIRTWSFGLFFFINWLAQAYMAIRFFHVFGSFETWICDASVFILPIIGNVVFKKKYEAEKLRTVLAERAKLDNVPPATDTEIHSTDDIHDKIAAESKIQTSLDSAPADIPLFCRKCGYRLADGSLFCSQCGTKIVVERRCCACGKEIEENAVFCRFCGERQEG